jgi:hypothetical protein
MRILKQNTNYCKEKPVDQTDIIPKEESVFLHLKPLPFIFHLGNIRVRLEV